jgi:hypothetical protein
MSSPFILKGNTAVDYWVIATTTTLGSTQTVSTKSIKQDTSGNNISFDIDIGTISPNQSFSITAQGYNAAGSAIATGQLVVAKDFFYMPSQKPFGSTINFKAITLTNDGTVSGLPSTYSSDTGYILIGPNGMTKSGSYSLSALNTALQTNTLFAQAFSNHQVLLLDLENVVRPTGYSSPNVSVTINGTTVPVWGHINNWAPVVIQSPTTGTVVVHSTTDGVNFNSHSSVSLSAGIFDHLTAGPFGNGNFSTSSTTSSALLTKVYFTDSSGIAITGLKIANLPLEGGILTSSSWIAAPSTTNTALHIYSGTVAQILSSKTTAPVGSLYRIIDSIENIQAAGTALYALEANNQIIGAIVTNGVEAIAMSSSSGYTPVTINDGAGHVTAIRVTDITSSNTASGMTHSPLAIKNSSSAGYITTYIDDQSIQTSSSLLGVGGAAP